MQTRRDEIAIELDALAARERELRLALDANLASIKAIRATWIYRITHVVRLVVPRRGAAQTLGADLSLPSEPLRPDGDGQPGSDAAPQRDESPERVLARRRAALSRLEEEASRVHLQLHHLILSRPRRAWIRLRANMVFATHPSWTLGALWRLICSRGLAGGIGTALHRFFWTTDLFRFHPLEDQRTDQPHAGDAIRWLPPVRISHQTRHALFMHPTSAVSFRFAPQAGSRVIADCGLLPIVWANNRGGVVFALDVEVPSLDWRTTRSLRINPGERFADRRWRRVAVQLPPGALPEVVVGFATTLPAGVSGANAWAVWGEPRIEWRRTLADRWRSIRAFGVRIRRSGLIGTLRQIRDLQSADEHTARYRRWIAINTPMETDLAQMAAAVAGFGIRPRISVITPVYNTDPRWLRACVESVRGQVYPDWELCLADDGSTRHGTLRVLKEYEALGDSRIHVVHCARNGGISAASNAALDVATGEFFALLDHDDELAPEALYEVARFLNEVPDADWIYSDEDKLDAAGERCDPYFKPDWSPEHFRSTMYTCHLMVLRASLVRDVGGFRSRCDGAQDYDLALRVSERSERIHHIPKMLYRWRKLPESTASSGTAKNWASDAGERALQDHVARCGLDATVVPGPANGLYRVRHRIAGKPLVSIIIPTTGRTRDVEGPQISVLECIQSIVRKSTYDRYELVIADDSSLPEATEAFLEAVPHTRVHHPVEGAFNYPRKLNAAVRESHGSHLLLFNDDIEVITPEWIEAMLEFSQQDAIGAVGPKLLYPDGRIQHIGVVMGVCGLAAHAFHGHAGSSTGYGSSALIIKNYSAVTAACMMTRRDLYERMNGFDERFALDFNDVDYCMRLRRAGYRIVFTPHAELCHVESATAPARTWKSSDLELMRTTWADVCERDPYYNPHLTRDFPDYRVRI
ncbi:MAG: glycosyltransferase [Acidobacteria bacterium]|nr:glycosyltransferase [Acidobacteriota bacterium]